VTSPSCGLVAHRAGQAVVLSFHLVTGQLQVLAGITVDVVYILNLPHDRLWVVPSIFGDRISGVTGAPIEPARKPPVGSSSVWVGADSSTISNHSLSTAQWKTQPFASRPPVQ
jgi:hypothetical protein